MTKTIKLMLDYQCSPLWWYETDKTGNIDPTTLPLSEETIQRLEALKKANDNSLNWDNPADSGEADSEEIDYFEREGISLWQQLQKELYPDYEVVYFSEKLRKVVTNINELDSQDCLTAN